MTLIVDVNLDLLKELHENGSVRNLKDRRTDLYSLKWKKAPRGKQTAPGTKIKNI
jgi:hypothetical protein